MLWLKAVELQLRHIWIMWYKINIYLQKVITLEDFGISANMLFQSNLEKIQLFLIKKIKTEESLEKELLWDLISKNKSLSPV